MGSRRSGKNKSDLFDPDDLSLQDAADLIYGDTAMLDDIDRRRVFTRPVGLDEITIDPAIQVRVSGLDEEVVEKYTQVLLNGGEFEDPVILFRESDKDVPPLYLADGFHRCEATRRALEQADLGQEIALLRGQIRPGGRDGAVEYAEEANLRHGKALSNADKRAIFERRWMRGHEWRRMSDRQVGALLGVSNVTIGNWRRELEQKTTVKNFTVREETRIGADGREYRIDKIRQASEQRAQPSASHDPSPRPELPAPRVQGTAQPSGKFDGMDPDRLANLLRVLNGAPPVIAMFIRHLSDEEVAFMRQLEADKLAPRPEVLLVLDRRLGPVAPSAESKPDHDPAYGLDLEPDEQPDMVTDHIPGDEQTVAYRLLTDLSTALQELRSMALALPKLGDLDALAVLDDTALDGVLGLIDETGADLAGHEDGQGQWVPGLLDHLAGWRAQVQEMLDDGDGAE